MAVSGQSEEYRLWHQLVVLHTLCLIKQTSNTLADFLMWRLLRRSAAYFSPAFLCICMHGCSFLPGKVFFLRGGGYFADLMWVNSSPHEHSGYSGWRERGGR